LHHYAPPHDQLLYFIWVIVLAVGVLAVGCTQTTPYDTGYDNASFEDLRGDVNEEFQPELRNDSEYRDLIGQLPIRSGSLDGNIGDVDGLRQDNPTDTSGWGEPYYASVYTVGWGDNGAAMTILEVEGGLHHDALQDGAELEFNLYDDAAADGLNIYTVGCSGPEENNWEFDQVADETKITVTEDPADPSLLNVDYEAQFTNWEDPRQVSNVRGFFQIARSAR
jgi:hypothetical protein